MTTVYDDAVRDSHQAGVATLGDAAATPVIHLAGAGGWPARSSDRPSRRSPVARRPARCGTASRWSPAPTRFFELRRPRTRRPDFN